MSIRMVSRLAAGVLVVSCNGCAPRDPAATDSTDMRWDAGRTQKPLAISADGLTLSWEQDADTKYQPSWLGSETTARLSGGVFTWDFQIKSVASRQIGVGLMLDPADWGFFGYLGASNTAWSYDAYEGAIVTATEAVHSGLPAIRERGTVGVYLDLKHKYEFKFIVNGTETPTVPVPKGSTVIPAACLLRKGQIVTIGNVRRIE
jgi:hypothetical protein